MKKSGLNINIRPFGFLDLLAFKKLIPSRKQKIAEAPAVPAAAPQPVNVLAGRLHPDRQYMIVSDIVDETPSARTYRLIADMDSPTTELAVFRPGQYLSFFFQVEESTVTRPYSISSSAAEALAGYYEITVKKNEAGYISRYIWENWHAGTKVTGSGPMGHFYHEDMRDSRRVIGLAGGGGVTPFRSMAKSILKGSLPVELTLFYGCTAMGEAIFHKEFKEMEAASGGSIKVVYVLSCEERDGCESGFITAETIRQHCDPQDSSFFICGPQEMYTFLEKELASFHLRKKYLRWEHFREIKNIRNDPAYPGEKEDQSFTAVVRIGNTVHTVPASSGESLLVALERAGINPPSGCRSGTCGFCRSLLINGDVFIPEKEDGRRAADKQFGYIHPCSTFPLSDLEIVVPKAR